MKSRRSFLALALLFPLVCLVAYTADRTSAPARTLRWLAGEPVAEQDVNDAADWLQHDRRGEKLERTALGLMESPADRFQDLPQYRSFPAKVLPSDAIGRAYDHLGGTFGAPPELVLWSPPEKTRLELRWGNGRHTVMVLREPPDEEPEGFAVRKVTARTFVVAR